MLILQIGHSKLSPKASLVPVQLKGGTIISSFLILDLHHCCKMHNKLSVQTLSHRCDAQTTIPSYIDATSGVGRWMPGLDDHPLRFL